MVRAAPLVLTALLLVPVADAAWYRLSYREMEGAGWRAETFEITNPNVTRIWVAFDARSAGEVTGHLFALYDGAGTLLRGATFFSEGGQPVEATVATAGTRVTNEVLPETAGKGVFGGSVYWSCDAACNPSRKFTLVAATGGDVEPWRYALLLNGAGTTRGTNVSGPEAWAYTTRQFEGEVAHVQTPVRGIHKVTGGTLLAHAEGTVLATFVKPAPSPDPRVMRVEGAVDMACPCFAGDWPAGDYTFRYEDQDVNGVEGLLVFADVDLP